MIELGKQYRTRGGQKVELFRTDREGLWPVRGEVFEGGEWISKCWHEDGTFHPCCLPSHLDLIEVTAPRPWSKPEDVPELCWIGRESWGQEWLMICGVTKTGIYLPSVFLKWDDLKPFRWSRSHTGRDAKACTVEGS